MKKHAVRRKLNRTGVRVLAVIGIAAAAVLIFLGVFYVPDQNASVVGNTRYTADEIREMVFTGFARRNSVYLTRFVKTVQPDNAPFVSSIEIEYDSHNRVTLQVNENNPIGYVRQDGYDYYFDAQGCVLEAYPSGTGSGTASDGTETAAEAVSATSSEQAEGAAEAVGATSSEQTEGAADNTVSAASDGQTSDTETTDRSVSAASTETGALQADMVHTSDTEFHPALTDVAEVTGLTEEKLTVGSVIAPADPGVFSTLLAITKIVSKLSIIPDSIEIQNGNQFILHYDDVLINIGRDTMLEEKMSRAAAILPQLSGMKGTLHLENFSEDTVNIIFDKDEGTETDATAAGSDQTDQTSEDSSGTALSDGTDSSGTDGTSGDGTESSDGSGSSDGTYSTDTTDSTGTDASGTGYGGTQDTENTWTYDADTGEYSGTEGSTTDGTDSTGTYGYDSGSGQTDGTDTSGIGTTGTDESGTDSGDAISKYEYQP